MYFAAEHFLLVYTQVEHQACWTELAFRHFVTAVDFFYHIPKRRVMHMDWRIVDLWGYQCLWEGI
jgi:hypothetical protein